VFIKPHACKGKAGAVEKVVADKFKASGIKITNSGEIDATVSFSLYDLL
jgi:hypothetical protein